MKIGILISGRGSNMMALADAIGSGLVPLAEIVVVISDNREAAGLERARERGLSACSIERRGLTRLEHETRIIERLDESGAEIICLAGYMRLLSSHFIEAFSGRILNIHPSLLPSFPGLDAQRQALEYGVKWTGCTVHFVDESLDGGPIIAQSVVPIHDDDTVETLSARILVEEHKLYPQAVAGLARGEYKLAGRRVISRAE